MKAIFHFPRVLGFGKERKLYPKSPTPQEVLDAHMDHWFAQSEVKAGAISPYVEPKEVAVPIQGKKAPKAKEEKSA